MMTYYPGETLANGSVSVILRYKLNFVSCSHSDTWQCNGNCGTQTQTALSVVEELSGIWCQREATITHLLPNNTGFQTNVASGNWINGIQNGVINWRALTDVELRNRSDINKPNTSPQTTIIPALRIPSNCAKNINLLAFDPDGDNVRCRYASVSGSECDDCTPPSVLSLSSSCSLSFSPVNSSNEGPYAVQVVMEDFPTQTIILTETNGSQEVKNPSDAISMIPLQFVLRVVPTVPSCVEGEYLPRFLSPTPENGAQLFTLPGQTLEITIIAQATQSVIAGFLYSGPHNAVKNEVVPGNYSLSWTPSTSESGQSHPICFVVQANFYSVFLNATFHSDLRCAIVTVGNAPLITTTTLTTSVPLNPPTPTLQTVNGTTAAPGPQYVIALNMKISTTLSLDDDSDRILDLIKQRLIDEGLTSDITLRLLSSGQVVVTTPSP